VNSNNKAVTFKTTGEMHQYEQRLAAALAKADAVGGPRGGKRGRSDPVIKPPPKKVDKECKFHKAGGCKKGDDCDFKHN